MTMWLRQSTAVTVKVGPFLDSGDGVTAEDSLTISQADVRLSKNGGDIAQKNESSSATHDELGYYDIALDTTDTNTLGRLVLIVSESGALPIWQTFMVVPANVWDSLFGADKLQVHADEITAGLITAAAIATNAIDADALATDAVTEIQSGLATAAALTTVNSVVDAIQAKTDNLPADPADASDIAAAFDALPTASEIADAVLDEPITEPGGVFAWGSATLRNIVGWLGAFSRNKMLQTNTTSTLRNDADNADIATSTVGDDGSTFTRGEWS